MGSDDDIAASGPDEERWRCGALLATGAASLPPPERERLVGKVRGERGGEIKVRREIGKTHYK